MSEPSTCTVKSRVSCTPPAALGYLCRQLEIPPLTALTERARDNTGRSYRCEITAYLGWAPDAAAVAKSPTHTARSLPAAISRTCSSPTVSFTFPS